MEQNVLLKTLALTAVLHPESFKLQNTLAFFYLQPIHLKPFVSVSLCQGCYFCSTTYTLFGFISAFMPGCCGCNYMYLNCRSCTVSICQGLLANNMLDDSWLCQQSLAGQADSVLLSLHPPSDSFSLVPQFGKEKSKSEEISEVPLLNSQDQLGNPVQPWIISTPVWSLLFRKCNRVLVLRLSSTVSSYSSCS